MTDLPFDYPNPTPANPAAPQPRPCRRHEPEPTLCGKPWPARCRYCSLVTQDPDAFFVPVEWAEDSGDFNYECPPSPTGFHVVDDRVRCIRCGHLKDAAASRRGRNNRKRGNSDELEVARILGGRKVGPLGHSWDVEIEGYLRAQCKRLDRWPSVAQILEWLDAIPAGPELRAVTLADTPGPGKRARRVIVFDLAEFAGWHGRAKP